MKIKRKVQKNLPQLIEWLLKSGHRDYIASSDMGNTVTLSRYGAIQFSHGTFFPEEIFTVTTEEEITEDTMVPKLMTTFKKTYLEGGIGYQRVRIDENYPIKLMLNKAEAHGEPIETLHIVNDDGTHTLIWRDGKLVE